MDGNLVAQLYPLFATEFMFLTVVLLYILNYLRGVEINKALAFKYSREIKSQLSPFFSSLEAELAAEDDEEEFQLNVATNKYVHYLSGNLMVESWTGVLNLNARQDLVLGQIVNRALGDNLDRLEITLRLDSQMIPANFIVALVDKRKAMEFKKERYDLSSFSRLIDPARHAEALVLTPISKSLTILCDNSGLDMLSVVFDVAVVELLSDIVDFVEHLVIGDQPTEEPAELPYVPVKTLTLSMKLDSTQSEVQIGKLVTLVFAILDNLGGYEMSMESMNKSKKQRQAAIEVIQKKLAKLTAKQVEEKRQLLEQQKRENIDNMTRAQRRKLEEKEAKRALRQRGMGKTKKMR